MWDQPKLDEDVFSGNSKRFRALVYTPDEMVDLLDYLDNYSLDETVAMTRDLLQVTSSTWIAIQINKNPIEALDHFREAIEYGKTQAANVRKDSQFLSSAILYCIKSIAKQVQAVKNPEITKAWDMLNLQLNQSTKNQTL